MAAIVSGDALDDLLDADITINDIYRDVDTNMEVPARRKTPVDADNTTNSLGLGIDEEVKIIKKRKAVVKLDENRLLSQAGIPKLRRIARERFRFKGKGHEYSDVARLLSIYQLWLDDLYPRAKFADGLTIIEKLGHTKRIQTMRREWINECKPRDISNGVLDPNVQISPSRQKNSKSQDASTTAFDTQERLKKPTVNIDNNNDDDLYSATPPTKPQVRPDLPGGADINDSLFMSDEDNLDALLAENFQETPTKSAHHLAVERKDEGSIANFDHDMEAMAEIDDQW